MTKLPGPAPDPYKNVDHRNFTTVHQLSRAQLVELADLAYSRGDTEARAVWQEAAMSHAKHEELEESGERMRKMLDPSPAFVSQPGQILEKTNSAPWDGDPDHKRFAAELATVEARIEATPDSQSQVLLGLQNERADIRSGMRERQEAITDGLKESGAWTEADERRVAAEKSLVSKSKKIAGSLG